MVINTLKVSSVLSRCISRLVALFLLLSAELCAAAVILQYHHVSDTTPASTSISPALFKQHLAYLADNGYQVWPLPRLAEQLKAQREIPDKVVVITFDDAYDSIYAAAYPMLRERNWPFTVFVAPAPIQQKLDSFMTWQQLAEMKQAGATIANHSFAHKHLVRREADENEAQWLERVVQDIETAQETLTRHLGETPKLLAYPYGEYTNVLADKLGELGYVAFGQQSGAVSGLHKLTELPRYPMTNYFGEMSQFKTKVASLPFPARQVVPAAQLVDQVTQPETLRIKLYPQAINMQQLSCYFSGKGRLASKVSRSDEGILIEIDQLPDMTPGRSRLNCTAPSSEHHLNGRFHWFSWFWMRKKKDGTWYEED